MSRKRFLRGDVEPVGEAKLQTLAQEILLGKEGEAVQDTSLFVRKALWLLEPIYDDTGTCVNHGTVLKTLEFLAKWGFVKPPEVSKELPGEFRGIVAVIRAPRPERERIEVVAEPRLAGDPG